MDTCSLIGLKVANDGHGLREALETQYDIASITHIGDFVFRASCKDQTILEIQTRPVELAAFHLRIVSIRRLN